MKKVLGVVYWLCLGIIFQLRNIIYRLPAINNF